MVYEMPHLPANSYDEPAAILRSGPWGMPMDSNNAGTIKEIVDSSIKSALIFVGKLETISWDYFNSKQVRDTLQQCLVSMGLTEEEARVNNIVYELPDHVASPKPGWAYIVWNQQIKSYWLRVY
jgi:hypothetical protein